MNQHFHLLDLFGIFIAKYLLYIMVLIFAFFWLRGDQIVKQYIVKAFVFTLIGGLISQSISYVIYVDRPFAIGLGHHLIEHVANGAFPSNHMFIFSSIAFSYLFSPFKKLGIFLLFIAGLVGWSRMFVGVHFPADILGGFILAFLVNYLGLSMWNKYKDILMSLILKIHRAIFKPFIRHGIIK